LRIDARNVCSLATITTAARSGKVFDTIIAAVLLWHDMLDVECTM
jgi:hypothetical protein